MAFRQKNKNVYFTGKVLNIKEEANDNAKSFRFSEEERNALDLAGIPIQLEHNDKLKVGTIERSWRDDAGQFWVFGAIDKNSVEGTFAKHAIQKKNNKSAYYTGLSLSHVHREDPDGKSEKVPIEVSLCTEPRRANCNIIWTSNKNDTNLETNKVPYKPVVEQATKNNMSAITEKQTTPQTEQTPSMEVETPTEPTGKELSEQVYNQFAELVEKEKGQTAKIAELEAQLQKHNESLEVEKKKKAEADAAKGQALMQTFIEHINDLVGPEENSLQPDIEPLIAQPGMNRVMEIVARASKKYKEQSMKLKETQNNLKDKELELKFQTLIKQNIQPQQVVEKASKKRAAPVAQNTAKVVSQTTKQAYNPYAFKVQGSSSRIAPRANMNENLLNAYKANRGAGMGAASRLHKSFQNRPKPTGPIW